MSHEIEQRIRERAYQLWAMSGYSHGQDEEHWCAAEREVIAAMQVPGKPKKQKAAAKVAAGAIAASNGARSKASALHS
jgi:Protein of unknown function (DUF2934)